MLKDISRRETSLFSAAPLRRLLPAGLPPGPPMSSWPPASPLLGLARKIDYLRKEGGLRRLSIERRQTCTTSRFSHTLYSSRTSIRPIILKTCTVYKIDFL